MAINSDILVTVVIPTYNRANKLARCIESITNQTYENLEIIIVDDQSTDNTKEIVKKLIQIDNRIIYLTSDQKGGNFARNKGIFAATGDYIAFMDDDDKSLPIRIESQINQVLNSNFYYDFIVSGYLVKDSNENEVSKVNYLKPLQSIGFPSRWLIKKSKLREVNGFDPKQPALQDIEIFWRLRNICKICFDPLIVSELISSPISVSKNSTNMIYGIERLIALHGSKMNGREFNSWIKTLGNNAFKNNDRNLVGKCIRRLKRSDLFLFDFLLIIGWSSKLRMFFTAYNILINYFYKKKQYKEYIYN
jgi:glycosyltransferase involved in cell wall biosynthesis